MRIALITDGIWPYVLGGMQKHSYYLCKYLARNKVNVDLFHFNQSNYDIHKLEFFTPEERQFINATVIEFPSGPRFPGHYLYNSYRYSKHIFHAIKKQLHQYEFIYTKGFSGWYLINRKHEGKVVCPDTGVKFHGYEMFQRAPDIRIKLQHIFLLRYPVAEISRRADTVFSYGGKITQIIKSIGVPAANIFEMPSGVEKESLVSQIKSTAKEIKFLFLGRYERRKGIQELNRALEYLNEKIDASQWKFSFIGPIPDRLNSGLKNCRYHGEIREKEKLTALVREHDVLVCPSWSEGMPNVILEAMSAGLCVLGTDKGATNILVDDSTGWLLKDPKPKLLAHTLAEIVGADRSLIDRKKNAALERIRNNFTWELIIGKFCEKFLG